MSRGVNFRFDFQMIILCNNQNCKMNCQTYFVLVSVMGAYFHFNTYCIAFCLSQAIHKSLRKSSADEIPAKTSQTLIKKVLKKFYRTLCKTFAGNSNSVVVFLMVAFEQGPSLSSKLNNFRRSLIKASKLSAKMII